LVSVRMLVFGSVMPESGELRVVRTSVGFLGWAMTVPSWMGPSAAKVKSGGRNQVGMVSKSLES
jgi:hypothetical protein